MQKLIDTINNIVKLIGSLLSLGLIVGVICLGYWVYAQFGGWLGWLGIGKSAPAESTKSGPLIDLSGVLDRKPQPDPVQRAIDGAWENWKTETSGYLANPAYKKSVGRWQSGQDGSTLDGFESLPPPSVSIMPGTDGQPTQIYDHHYLWIGKKPTKLPADSAARGKKGDHPGRWFDVYSRTYVLGYHDTMPEESVASTSDSGKVYTEKYAWVWTNKGEIEPPNPPPTHIEFAYSCTHSPRCAGGNDTWKCVALTELAKCTHTNPCKTADDYRATHEDGLYRRCQHQPRCSSAYAHVREYLLDIAFPPDQVKAAQEALKKQGLWRDEK